MYCIATKKNPKLAKKRNVMPIDSGGEVGLDRTGVHPATDNDAAVRTTANAAPSTTPATMHPQTIGCVQPRVGASTTPNTNTASAAPISTAPTQSSGVAVSSRDDLIVHVAMNRAMPEAANP